ncbi:Mitochondrial import inner membrane translocase subunit tim22 [Tulasnella sp. 418]|nr:Mitochondrial import inner membrane translocase subunit tim22 [Tulasnella sp. 418]
MNGFPANVLPPIHRPGQEPLPPGYDRDQYDQNKRVEKYMNQAMESCVAKSALSGVAGVGFGVFLALMSGTFSAETSYMTGNPGTVQKTSVYFKELGQNMWRSGRNLGKVGALYAGVECAIEGYRAKNDITNAVAAGFVTGGILARASGPRAALAGGMGFAAFSAAIDLFLRRETADED